MITDFLGELGEALAVPERRRRQILVEVEDHLLCVAAELHASGLSAVDAEREAVARFGPAGGIGRELSEVEARRHAVRAGEVALPVGVAAAWLGLRGVAGLGATRPLVLAGFVLAQVALLAGGLTAFRAWLVRRGGDPAILILVRRGSLLVVGCLLALGLSAGFTAVRHAGESTALVAGLAVGGGALLAVVTKALRRALAWPAPPALDPAHNVLRELAPVLGGPTSARLERWISLGRRPWRFGWAVALAAGLALALAHGVSEGGPPDLAHLPRAVLGGAILAGAETFSALAGFLLLGRWLGIRPSGGRRFVPDRD